ncbi:MAG: gamma carbonic anhydrase family protein [Alphaproteobacteria bacterium]
MAIYQLAGVQPVLPAPGAYWLAPTATLIGNVRLEADASVWFGAVVRGDNEPIVIGARSNVQDNCVLHTDPGAPLTLGQDCTIGHQATLHGCTIGAGSLVGIGATILNNAVIGARCIIGAHALVPEGMVVAPGSLVLGTPGRVARTLSAGEVEKLARSASDYVARWQHYAQGLVSAEN